MPFVTVSAPLLLFVRPEFSLPRDSALIKPTAAQAPRMHCERPCPVVSPRGAERNYKDTTNGARTLTAKTLDGWPEKSLRTRSWDVLRAGGCFPASSNMLYSMRGKMSTTFLQGGGIMLYYNNSQLSKVEGDFDETTI